MRECFLLLFLVVSLRLVFIGASLVSASRLWNSWERRGEGGVRLIISDGVAFFSSKIFCSSHHIMMFSLFSACVLMSLGLGLLYSYLLWGFIYLITITQYQVFMRLLGRLMSQRFRVFGRYFSWIRVSFLLSFPDYTAAEPVGQSAVFSFFFFSCLG